MTEITHEAAVSKPDAAAHAEKLLAAALSYAARGWHVFPCHSLINGACSCGKPDCRNTAKHPMTPAGFHDATTDELLIRAWWEKWPLANIGIATGAVSGFVVVDVDDKAGLSVFRKLAGRNLRDIPRQRTGREPDGWHFLFSHPGIHVKNGVKFLPGLDSRGDGGYIVAAPSLHVSGRQYKVLYLPKNDEFPELTKSLLDAINGVTSTVNGNGNGFKPPFDTAAALKGAPVGTRHGAILGLAGKLRQADVPMDTAEKLILEAARNCEQPPDNPFTDEEALTQLRGVYKRYPAGTGLIVISDSAGPPEDLSEDSVSMRDAGHLSAYKNEDLSVSRIALQDGGMAADTAFPEAAWTGLFLQWRDTVAPCTEAALVALWGAFLLAVGMVIGRNAWRWSPRALYPNFYLLLIGQTGDSRKSTVLWFACELLRYVGVDFKQLDGVVSSEGIYEALAEREGMKGLVYADEFRALLSVAKRKGTQDILPKLNSLYYCPERSSIDRVKDSTVIVRPFVSLLTATPQAYVEDILGDLEISGGFLNRFLIISGPEQEPKPIVKSPSIEAWESIAAELRKIEERTLSHLDMTSEAEELWIDFYTKWKKERRGWQPQQANLSARTFEHILKISVVYSVLAGQSKIGIKSLEIAVAIGKWIKSNTLRLFADTGLDHFGKCERAIIDILKRARNYRLWRRDLQRLILSRRFNSEIFGRAVKALTSNDQVRCYSMVSQTTGKERQVVEYLQPRPNETGTQKGG